MRCFLDERISGDASGEESFREVQMNADTLWVDADAEQLVLVWRGVAKVSSAGCPELRRIFVAAERLDRPTASLDDCRSTFMQVVAEREAEFDPQPEAPLSDADEQESTAAPDAKAAAENEFDVAHRDALASSDAQLRATW